MASPNWYEAEGQLTLEGHLVEIHGLEAPLEPSASTLEGAPELEPVDVNGEQGRVVGWSAEDGKYVIETFDGLIVGVPEENLARFEPRAPQAGGFDLVWPSGPALSGEFAGEVIEVMQQKGWCMVQMFSQPGGRKAAVAEALELVDWRLGKKELEVQYMGLDNCTKYAELDPDDLSKACTDALAECDRRLSELGMLLEPLAERLGFSLWGRHVGQVRVPFQPSEERFLRPTPLSDYDYEAGGKVYKHLEFMERRKLLALYMIDNEGGEVSLHQVRGCDLEKDVLRLPLSRGKLLLLQPDRFSYSYRPRGESSVLLQTWYATGSPVPDITDARVVQLPASVQGDRAHVKALQFRFGGRAHSPVEAWNMWVSGTDCAITIPTSRYNVDMYYQPDGRGMMYTCHFAGIEESLVMGFDHDFFDLSLAEAEQMAPEQKNVLEVGYEVLAAAGYTKQTARGLKLGIWLGDAGTDWKVAHACPRIKHLAMSGQEVTSYIYPGWQMGMSCSRLSHVLDMKGPCFAVDTACSSSLVALVQACRALAPSSGDQRAPAAGADLTMAMPMGICLDDGPQTFLGYCAATMLSAHGRSFTFDESANGFLRGEGCGGAFVKVSDSDADAQQMMGCVIGANVNQDGRSASMTAPNGPSQQQCIKASMAEAGLRPSEITIAECHGTGTALGDPIEVGALREVMKDRGDDPLIMTSGKANFGHMEACAGIGGIVKCILMLNSVAGACNIHFRCINPHIEFVGYPAVFNDDHVDCGARTAIAGVSSFGVGGTNARGDLWGRSKMGYLATSEINTFECMQMKGMAYSRVALNGQPGPGVTDRVFIMGTWDAWSSMQEMDPVGEGAYTFTIVVGDVGWERFRIVLNEDKDQTIYPAADLAGPHEDVLGPDWQHKGRCWLIDGYAHGASAGDAYRIKFQWTFSWDVGERKRITWEQVLDADIPGLEAKRRPYEHQYAIRGSWSTWKPTPLRPRVEEPGLFQATVRIGVTGEEEFQFIRDRDEAQVIHPECPRAMRPYILVRGPDGQGKGKHWLIKGPTGEIVTVWLRVCDEAIEVTVTSPTIGRKTWCSGERRAMLANA